MEQNRDLKFIEKKIKINNNNNTLIIKRKEEILKKKLFPLKISPNVTIL
jgi:hypothetical protein